MGIQAIRKKSIIATAIAIGSTLATTTAATAAQIKVTVENIAPENGLFISRLWAGFHDGSFDSFNLGEAAPEYIERLAEDAIIEPTGPFENTISTAFTESGAGTVQGIILGPTGDFKDFFPGDSASQTFTLDPSNASSRYFSYGAMGLPSNDAFIANENPQAIEIFDENGNFLGADFVVTGNGVWNAGTEVNDEIPENTAALAQAAPNTGVDENGVVTSHPGFIPDGNILAAFPNADFTQPGYEIARIKVEEVEDVATVPEPGNTVGLFALGGLLLLSRPGRDFWAKSKS